jgi:hypothetical protein
MVAAATDTSQAAKITKSAAKRSRRTATTAHAKAKREKERSFKP